MDNKGGLAVLLVLLLCVAGYLLWSNTGKEDGPDGSVQENIIEEKDMEGANYHYKQLTDDEKTVYRMIYQGCKEYKENIGIKSIAEESARRVLFAFRYDHPEFYWVKDDATITSTLSNISNKISFKVPADAESRNKKIEKKADEILSSSPSGEYEKIKYIYEYIIDNTRYDMNAPDNQTAYSVLINGSSVCGGYASAFQFLCDKAGIECGYISGEIIGKGPHAWNFVKIGPNYYWVDTTWGDPAYFDTLKGPETIFYDYLCASDEDILGNRILCNDDKYSGHESYMDFTYPRCFDGSLNYYYKMGGYISSYSRVAVYNAIVMQAFDPAKSLIVLKFATEEEFNRAVDDLFLVNNDSAEIINELAQKLGGEFQYGDIMTVGGNIRHLIIKRP